MRDAVQKYAFPLLLAFLLLFVGSGRASAQGSGKMIDVLPLEIGNTWYYQYTAHAEGSLEPPYFYEDDSGTVICTITDATFSSTGDSIDWHFDEIAMLHIVTVKPDGPSKDTVYYYSFILRESRLNNRAVWPPFGGSRIFVFWRPRIYDPRDTLTVYRFGVPSYGDIISYVHIGVSPDDYSVQMKKDVGIVDMRTKHTQMGYYITSEGHLLSQTVASVGPKGEGAWPREFALYQNYPNPFNPFTIIKYTVGGVGD